MTDTTEKTTTEKTQPRLELSGVQVVGGALAATTSAVAASYLGVAGTLTGAALGSVVATVGGSLYTYSLRRTTHTVRTVAHRTPAGTTVTASADAASRSVGGGAATPATVVDAQGAADGSLSGSRTRTALLDLPVPAPVPEPGPARRGAGRRWGPLVAAGAAFAVAVGGITAVELVAGETIAGVVYSEPTTGGTTLGSVVTRESQAPDPGDVAPEPTPSVSASPGGEDPATDPTASPSPSSAGESTSTSGPDASVSPAPGEGESGSVDPTDPADPVDPAGDDTATQESAAVDGSASGDSTPGHSAADSQPVAAPPATS